MALHPSEESINITRKFLEGQQGGQGGQTLPPGRIIRDPLPGGDLGTGIPRTNPPLAPGRRRPPAPPTRPPGQMPGRIIRNPLPGMEVSDPARRRPLSLGQQGSSQEGSLGDRFLGLPGPIGFAQTPQGRAILQRILGGIGRRR